MSYEDRLRAENDTMRDMLERIARDPDEVCWSIRVQETLDAIKRSRYTGQYCQICGKTLDEYTPPNANVITGEQK